VIVKVIKFQRNYLKVKNFFTKFLNLKLKLKVIGKIDLKVKIFRET